MADATTNRSDARATIIDVAARLLQERGPGAVTTRGVAEGAGMQAPAIYRLFGDKDGLLDAVAEHVMAAYVSTKAEHMHPASTEGVDPIDDLRAAWRTQIEFGVANPTLFVLLSDPGRGQRSPAARSGLQILQSRVHRVALTGRLRVSEQRAVDLIHAAGTGAVLTVLAKQTERRDLSLADDLFDAVLGRIVTDAPDQPEGALAASAVAMRALAPTLDMLTDAERRLLAEWLDRVIETAQP